MAGRGLDDLLFGRLARWKSTKRGEEGTNSVSDGLEGSRPNQRWALFRRSSRSLTSRSSQSLQNQTKSRASSSFRRLRRSSTSENVSNEHNHFSGQAIPIRGLRRASGLASPNSPISWDPQVMQMNGPAAISALTPKAKVITFEDQENGDNTTPNFVPLSHYSSSQVNSTQVDQNDSVGPSSPLSGFRDTQPSFPIISSKSIRTTGRRTTCSLHDRPKSLDTEEFSDRHPETHEENTILSREDEGLEEFEPFDNTDDEGSRPTKVIRLDLDDGPSRLRDSFMDPLNTCYNLEDTLEESDPYLLGIGNWAEAFHQPYFDIDGHQQLSKHFDKKGDPSTNYESSNDLKTSFLSLDLESSYADQVGHLIGQAKPFVSAWLLFCIAVLRIEKLRLSSFIHTALLRIGMDLSNRFDLDPDRLVEESWFFDAAVTRQTGSKQSCGKPDESEPGLSSNVFRELKVPKIVKDAITVGETKDQGVSPVQNVPDDVATSEKPDNGEVQNSATEVVAMSVGQVMRSANRDLLVPKLEHQTDSSQAREPVASSSPDHVVKELMLPIIEAQDKDNLNESKSESGREADTPAEPNFLDISLDPEQDDELRSTSPIAEVHMIFLTSESVNNRHTAEKFFIRGRVFSVVWYEPIRSANSPPPKRPKGKANKISQAPNGDWIYSYIRRFIIVESRGVFSIAVPINSYGGKGLNKKKFTEAERKGHAIVHPEDKQPQLLKGEEPFTKQAIAVEPSPDADANLDAASRINFRKPTTIEWHNRVANIGLVSNSSLAYLTTYYNDEFKTRDTQL